jgi:acyl-CoA synthetase (AMP-forming)/AMP-acid ligase II
VPLPKLPEILLEAANARPQRVALRFLDPKGESEALTFTALDQRARRISEFLVRRVAAGSAVLLAFPPGLDFLPAFLGCLYARVLGAPVAPSLRTSDRDRIEKIATDCKAVIGLTVRELSAKFSKLDGAAGNTLNRETFEWLNVEDILDGNASFSTILERRSLSFASPTSSNEVAYIQYTSGSTSVPRGVEVTLPGLVHNLHCIVDALAIGSDDVCVTWLPHFHDMGLVGTLLAPLFVGASTIVLSPFDFVRAPIKWLQAFTDFRGTFTASPDFGYALCASRAQVVERSGLDLTSWRAAANGSETVRAETVRRFIGAFSPAGFAPSAMAPCYGLAEATLIVSVSRPSKPVSFAGFNRTLLSRGIVQESEAADALTLVGCGPPVLGTEIAIIDPLTHFRRATNQVGEICIRSESVAGGYHNQEPTLSDCFHTQIPGEQGLFLRTGDLGFIHHGELFVTGRMKDIVIVRGRNIHSEDIELAAQGAHPELRANRGVAFSVDGDQEEGVVILQEVKATLSGERKDEVIRKVRAAINRVHGFDPMEIALLSPRTIGLTSSGKLARWKARAAWTEGRTPYIARWMRPRAGN